VAETDLFKWRHYESEIILLCILAASSRQCSSAPDAYREGDAELWRSRVPRRALERLERHMAKVIRASDGGCGAPPRKGTV